MPCLELYTDQKRLVGGQQNKLQGLKKIINYVIKSN